jgi:hypothetical protein
MKRQTLVLFALFGLLMMAILPAQADHVDPIKVIGSSNCTTVGSSGDFSLKIEPVTAGPHTGPDGSVITIFLDGKQPNTFSFVIEGGLAHDVIVKGSAANWYDFAASEGGPVSFHNGLTIPNGNALNRAWFCYDAGTAEIAGTKFNDTNTNGVADPGEPGIGDWQIFLLRDTGDGFTIVDSMGTDADGKYSFPDPGTGSYVVCEAANGPGDVNWQQSGPENDVCPDSVFDVESPVDLAAGGYAVNYQSGTRVAGLDFFNFNEDEVVLICGQEVSVGSEGTTAAFTRLPNDSCQVEKTAELRIEQRGLGDDVGFFDVIVFFPSGETSTNFSGTLTFTKAFSDSTLLVLQYDPVNDGVDEFRNVPACEDATFDGDGKVVTATIPNPDVESWCFASVEGHPIGDPFWQVTWQVFGTEDPVWK